MQTETHAHTVPLAQHGEARAASREHLVRIALVRHVPHNLVVGGIEHVVEGHRELCHAQRRGEMAASS